MKTFLQGMFVSLLLVGPIVLGAWILTVPVLPWLIVAFVGWTAWQAYRG